MINVLSKIQKELKAPKSNVNDFGNYKYRSCEDILEAVKPLIPEGVMLTLTDDIVLVGDRYYVKATATLSDDKKHCSASAFAREPLDKKGSDASQITGAASSYARKYALNGLFCIDDTKDADSEESAPATKSEPKKAVEDPYSDKEANELIGRIRKTPQLSDLNYVKEIARVAWPRMSALQRKTIGDEIEKRTAFFAQAPLAQDEIPY